MRNEFGPPRRKAAPRDNSGPERVEPLTNTSLRHSLAAAVYRHAPPGNPRYERIHAIAIVTAAAAAPTRVVTCLSNDALAHDLHALLDVGYTTQATADLNQIVDHTTSYESPVVVLDDAEQHWLTSVVNLMLLRPGARPVLLSDIDEPDAFLGRSFNL